MVTARGSNHQIILDSYVPLFLLGNFRESSTCRQVLVPKVGALAYCMYMYLDI